MSKLWRGFRVELILLVGVCLFGAAIASTNQVLEGFTRESRESGNIGPLPDGRVIRVLSLGFDRLLADLFWIRTLYYVGDDLSHRAGYPAAARLAELVTDIDPTFRTVYAVMPGVLTTMAQDPDAAIALLEKGVRNVDYWKLHFYLGFNYFFEKLDFKNAAKHLELAAAKPGGPAYLHLLASRLYAQAGEQDTALLMIRERLKQAATPEEREVLERRIWNLWISRDLESIDRAIESFTLEHRAAPATVESLIASGLLDAAPRDPRGGEYRIEAGRAATDLPHEKLEVLGLKGQDALIQRRTDARNAIAELNRENRR